MLQHLVFAHLQMCVLQLTCIIFPDTPSDYESDDNIFLLLHEERTNPARAGEGEALSNIWVGEGVIQGVILVPLLLFTIGMTIGRVPVGLLAAGKQMIH
eukprot:2652433-Rhodomonas_salina.1